MSSAIIKRDSSMALSDVMTLGDVFKASGYFADVRDQAQAVVKVLYGQELGFSPVVSMLGLHVIEGKPALSSNLMAALIKRSGKYDYRVKLWTNEECVLIFREKIEGKWDEIGEASFSMDDAKRAKVRFEGARGPSGWAKFPKAMLFARALSQGIRAYCPDVSIAPIYVPEELGAEVDEEGNVKEQPKATPERKEPISFKKSAAVNKDQNGTSQGATRPASVVETVPAADTDSTGKIAETVLVTNSGDSDARDTGIRLQEERRQSVASTPVEFISKGQAANFHATCRKAVREERYNDADDLTYTWLRDHGYYDVEDGVKIPTAAKIPAAGWLEVRAKAVDWLKKQ